MAKATTRKQRQRRRSRQVKRVEFVLNADRGRDQAIYDHLAKLTRHNEASDWIKSVLYAAIGQGEQPSRATGTDSSAILAELADLKRELRRRPASPPQPPPVLHDTPADPADPFGGLDMSRRRKSGPPKVLTAAPAAGPAPALENAAAAALLLKSIRQFGNEPGTAR